MPSPLRPVPRRTFLAGSLTVLAGLVAGCGGHDQSGTAAPRPDRPEDGPTSPRAAVGTTVGSGPPLASATGPETSPTPHAARFVARGPDTPARAALTFHTDGDVPLVRRAADILREHHTVATCFVVGRWLEANPTWARTLLDLGCELGNHTYTHPSSGRLSAAALEAEIQRCRSVLVNLTGDPGRCFRPSGTDDGAAPPAAPIMAAATAAGYPIVAGFDVDPLDYRDPGAAVVRRRTAEATRPGSIVSLHFGHAGTVEALPGIIDDLTGRGLELVTVSALLDSTSH